MSCTKMPRRSITFRIDERVIDGLKILAKSKGDSTNRWLEKHLFGVLQDEAIISMDEEFLGETRGGDRTSTDPLNEEVTEDD